MQAVRICVRGLPPDVTEAQFRAIPHVQEVLNGPEGALFFYSPEEIGDTPGPARAMAIVTLPAEQSRDFSRKMMECKFKHPFKNDEDVTPVVEWAPFPPTLEKNPVQQGKIASIDNDPEFVKFERDYEMSLTPPTDRGEQAMVAETEVTSIEDYARKLMNGDQGSRRGGRGNNRGKRERR